LLLHPLRLLAVGHDVIAHALFGEQMCRTARVKASIFSTRSNISFRLFSSLGSSVFMATFSDN
jgi:hypothetical protein